MRIVSAIKFILKYKETFFQVKKEIPINQSIMSNTAKTGN